LDFGGLQASDQAEAALAKARRQLDNELPPHQGDTAIANSGSGLLGINEDVVEQVGHTLGQFATEKEIQDCAAWLRSTSPTHVYTNQKNGSASVPDTPLATIDQHNDLLRQAFMEAGEVTSAFAKTFYLGTLLLGDEKARQAIWAIYVWCRRTDEIVDAPRPATDDDAAGHKAMLRDLSNWEVRLEKLWNDGAVVDVYDLTLLQTLVQYPNLDMTPFKDMIRGMLMDVPDLGPDRYETFDDLHLYCYRVAGTVGLMSLPVFGCAPGYTDEVAR
jgi:phytoene synthase